MLARAQAAFRVASILALLGGVAAQQTVIVAPNCTLSAYNWTSNSLGQNVCQISALALSACAIGTVQIPALQSSINAYQGPAANDVGDICKCNTVLYSLLSACGGCQGGLWEPYPFWVTNCTSTAPQGEWPADQVGFPKGTAFPAWAFLPISNTSGNIWNNLTAFEFFQTNSSQVTSLPGPTSTTASASNTASATAAAESQAAAGASSGGSSHAGAIAGGVVGGVVGALLLAGFAWFLVKRNRRRVAPSAQFLNSNGNSSAPAFVGGATTVQQPTTPRKFYDPSDPSTYPDALGSSSNGLSSSPGPTTASPGPTINTTHREPGHQPMSSWGSSAEVSGEYRGLPEV